MAAVALVASAVHLFSLQNGFLPLWDDAEYILDNWHIRRLNIELLEWAFLGFYAANWHPLTWLSHALDYRLWGLAASGRHFTNVVLHAVNSFVVTLLAMRVLETFEERTGTRARGSFVDATGILIVGAVTGLLFGIHPLRVESVAWVSERKDLLCGMFFLLALWQYLNYAERAGRSGRGGAGGAERAGRSGRGRPDRAERTGRARYPLGVLRRACDVRAGAAVEADGRHASRRAAAARLTSAETNAITNGPGTAGREGSVLRIRRRRVGDRDLRPEIERGDHAAGGFAVVDADAGGRARPCALPAEDGAAGRIEPLLPARWTTSRRRSPSGRTTSNPTTIAA